jgi:hypothetical protein
MYLGQVVMLLAPEASLHVLLLIMLLLIAQPGIQLGAVQCTTPCAPLRQGLGPALTLCMLRLDFHVPSTFKCVCECQCATAYLLC